MTHTTSGPPVDVLTDSQKYYQSNSIVQQYEQEKNYAYDCYRYKNRKANFSHLYYRKAQRQQRQERKKFAIVFTHLIMHMHEPEVRTNGEEEFQVSS